MLKKIALSVILCVVIVLNILRFAKLDTIPYGYHVDEVGSAVTVGCYAESGCDAQLKPWPLFGFMEYGQDKPPTYVYPGLLWAKAFGSTVPSLRAYTVSVLLIGILGLFFLSKELFGKSFAIVVVLCASCSPWAWVMNRVALESFFAPRFCHLGAIFFLAFRPLVGLGLGGFSFSCAMYAYPPARLQIPIMLITLGIYEWGRREIRWSSITSLIGVFILTFLPMVPDYLNGKLSRRFNDISILNHGYLQSLGKTSTPWDIISIFIHNYLLHFTPDFLFFTGDPSFVHSTRHLGIFSFLDIGALFIAIIFLGLAFFHRTWDKNPLIKHQRWLLFLTVNFFIGIIPSALTNQELPHALRICGSWSMMMLFSGFMWWVAAECLSYVWPAIVLTGILCGSVLTYQYFVIYPKESLGMFDYVIKDAAEQLKTQEDWQKFLYIFHRRNYHCRYFLVHRLGMTCKQANDTWWQLFYYLNDRKLF